MPRLPANMARTIAQADAAQFLGASRRAGTCALQPPGIKHTALRHCGDMELTKITAPADFTTKDAQ